MPAHTFIGAGAAVTGNNATLNPPWFATPTVGDTVVILASSRNNVATVTVPSTPADWTRLPIFASTANVQVFGRVYDGSWTMPSVVFAPGLANADTLAQAATFRNTQLRDIGGKYATASGTAANPALPAAVAPGRDNCMALYVAWRKDDWTSAATLGGSRVEIGEAISTLGDDAAMVWDYEIQTTAASSLTATSWTITGGVSANYITGVIFLDPAPTITVVAQDVYPPRVLISVSFILAGDAVSIYRVVGGVRTLIRGGADASADSTAFLRVDAELPFGVPVSYVVIVNGTEFATAAVTYSLPGGKVVLADAVTGAAAEVTIMAWPERAYGRQSSTYRVGGRNVVVSGALVGFEGSIELYTETTSARDNVMALVAGATEGIIHIRQPGGYDGVDCYIVVRSVTERRFSQDGTDQRRRLVLEAIEVEAWADTLESPGFTLQDIADVYTPGVLDDIDDDYATLLALAQGDFS